MTLSISMDEDCKTFDRLMNHAFNRSFGRLDISPWDVDLATNWYIFTKYLDRYIKKWRNRLALDSAELSQLEGGSVGRHGFAIDFVQSRTLIWLGAIGHMKEFPSTQRINVVINLVDNMAPSIIFKQNCALQTYNKDEWEKQIFNSKMYITHRLNASSAEFINDFKKSFSLLRNKNVVEFVAIYGTDLDDEYRHAVRCNEGGYIVVESCHL